MAEYTGQNSGFLSASFNTVNNALNNFANSYSDIIAKDIAPLVAGGLVLTFITMGVMAIRGLLDRPFLDVAWTMTRASIITAIALSSAVYSTWIVDTFLTLPDDMMSSISSAVSGGNSVGGQGAAQAIEDIYMLGSYNAGLYFNEAGLTNIAPLLYGCLVLIGTIACVLMGALWLFISKVILALMLGVGPLFICCLIWNPTQQYFWSWIGQILNAVLTTVFVLAVFSIFAEIFSGNLKQLEVDVESAGFMNAAFYTFLGILCMGVLMQIPQYVSALTGAAGGAVGTAMSRITKGAVAMTAGAAAGVAGGALAAGRGAYAGSQALGAYKQARTGTGSFAGETKGRLGSLNAARHEFNRSMDDMKRGYPMHYQRGTGGNKPQVPTVPYHAGGGGVNLAKPTTGSKYSNK